MRDIISWRPLFQRHKNITAFKELEEFYLRNHSSLEIYDEYGRRYTWNQYRDKVYRHSQCRRQPFRWFMKWIHFYDRGPRLHTVPCEEKDADIYTPFSHNEYMKKEHLARQRFHVYERAWCDANIGKIRIICLIGRMENFVKVRKTYV